MTVGQEIRLWWWTTGRQKFPFEICLVLPSPVPQRDWHRSRGTIEHPYILFSLLWDTAYVLPQSSEGKLSVTNKRYFHHFFPHRFRMQEWAYAVQHQHFFRWPRTSHLSLCLGGPFSLDLQFVIFHSSKALDLMLYLILVWRPQLEDTFWYLVYLRWQLLFLNVTYHNFFLTY